jgi:sodium/bile acid cotransporter 7
VVLVWGSCIALHLAALAIAWWGARAMRVARPEAIGAAFAASQKTLPIGILLATDKRIFGNPDLLGPGLGVPFAIFPMLMFHASQLFLDDLIADRFAAGNAPPVSGKPDTTKA